jgi:multicomponent Na+:H+ antiporter subunit G
MIADTIIMVCLGIGLIFNALGVIGILRFPDVYTRLHAETKTTTFGTIFISLAVIVYAVSRAMQGEVGTYLTLSVHTFIALLALAFTNATGAHAIARAAHRSGQVPKPAVVDRLQEVRE